MANEIMIPALPCASINDVLQFYTALGFEITYQQERPNNYACVRLNALNLHFFSMKGYDPAQSYSTCIVLVPDVAALRQAFVTGLRQTYSKLPAAGIPRITPLRKKADGGHGFNVIDPGGNWIRISQHSIDATIKDESITQPASSKLQRAIQTAVHLAESKGDVVAAAKLLDKALTQAAPIPVIDYVQAVVVRAALAIELNDPQQARELLTTIQQLTLDATQRATLQDELQHAAELIETLA